MSPAPGWYFGGLPKSDEQFGGFNLGGVQTPFQTPPNTVSAPSAGVAGLAPGQPPSPTGGMTALGLPFAQPETDAGTPGTGPAPGQGGPGFSVGSATTAGAPTVGGLATGQAVNAGLGIGSALARGLGPAVAASSLVPGPTSLLGVPALISSLAMANMVDPASNTPIANIAKDAPAGPVFAGSEGFAGRDAPAVGDPNTAIGRAIAEIQNSNPPTGGTGGFAFGSNGSTIDAQGNISNSLGTKTGESQFPGNPNPANIPPAKGSDNDPDAPTAPADPTSTDPSEGMSNSGPTGQGPGGPGAGAGPGSGAAGASGGAPGAGDAGGGSAGSGGTGAGASAGDKRGGVVGQERERAQARQRGQRPDARMLAAKLQRGARVDVGKRANVDSVPVHLARGEYVVNRASTQRNLPELERINQSAGQPTGRGGFNVGQPRDQRR